MAAEIRGKKARMPIITFFERDMMVVFRKVTNLLPVFHPFIKWNMVICNKFYNYGFSC